MRNDATGRPTGRKDGIALIIVLGLLAILTLLAVSFAIAMRVEWLAAWNYGNGVRAQQMVYTAFARAIDDVNDDMAGRCFPDWKNRVPISIREAMGTINDGRGQVCNLLEGAEVSNAIPMSLWYDASQVTAYWTNIVSRGGRTNGCVSWLVVNVGGLQDANLAGGRSRIWSTNINEINLACIPEMQDTAVFYSTRTTNVRYETIMEMRKLNTGLRGVVSNFFPYSLDIGRDVYFNNASELGRRDAVLKDKFDVNSITNYLGYQRPWDYDSYNNDNDFKTYYRDPVIALLTAARLERPSDVVWSLVNWLDPDRIPQGGEANPWAHTEGGEAIPLINEIVFRRVPGLATNEYRYEFVVELWFPFAPAIVASSDNFKLQVGVFTNNWKGRAAADSPNETNVMNYAYTNWSIVNPPYKINDMKFGTSTEFLCVTCPAGRAIEWTYVTTNTPPKTNTLPIGVATYTGMEGTNIVTRTVTNMVWFDSRVVKCDTNDYGVMITNPVDEAMGYEYPDETAGNVNNRALMCFTNEQGYSIMDPRSNGQVKYWTSAGETKWIGGTNYLPTNAVACTLGYTNVNCNPWWDRRQGLPIFALNGPMRNIGELGYLFRSNLDDEANPEDWYWRTIDLMSRDEGAALLDWMTVRPTNRAPAYGLFAINSRQKDAMRALFYKMKIGVTNIAYCDEHELKDADVNNLVDAIVAQQSSGMGFVSFTNLFTTDRDGGPVARAFRKCCPNLAQTNDILKEDTFRYVLDLVTFRQNMFVIVLAAQVYGGDGATVVAEKRALATVYRDSYTGRHFLRSFKWLAD